MNRLGDSCSVYPLKMPSSRFSTLLTEVRAWTPYAHELPLGPRPIVQAGRRARILIVGQAPGTKVHATGIPFNDLSLIRNPWFEIDVIPWLQRRVKKLLVSG